MDWIQCNNCGSKPNQTKVYLTTCGHIFCQNCKDKAKESQCCLCKKRCQADEINKGLRPELMELFKDPRQLATDLVNELKQVATFQAKQREIFMKFRVVQEKKEMEKVNESRTKEMKMEQEMERRKKLFTENTALLKSAKEERKELTMKLNQLRKESENNHFTIASKHSRTDPQISKSARVRPPSTVRKASNDYPMSMMDQSTSKIVTSTPICNNEYSRRDYMTRMFGAGLEHPSPIPRQ